MLYNTILSAEIESTKEMKNVLPDLKPHEIDRISSKLSLKGYLHRLKKGTYIVQEKPTNTPIIKNPYKIALALFKGYIGFSSALRVYDLIDYEPFTIFVITKNKSREKKIGEYTFKSVAMGKRAVGMAYYKGIFISTISKTFFDCFYKPQYGGGYSTITKALYETNIDWDEFIKYFELSSDSLCQRTGYVLDLMGKETGKVPEYIIEHLKKRIKNNTKLLPSGSGSGTYVKDWMVLDNLGKENMLSWWYHG